jgi:hypothetical protein
LKIRQQFGIAPFLGVWGPGKWCRRGGLNIHILYTVCGRRGRARIWGRGLIVVGSCTGPFGVREREARTLL